MKAKTRITRTCTGPCGITKRVELFPKGSPLCFPCHRAAKVVTTSRELEEVRSAADVARFLAKSAEVREAAGCPRRAG